MIRQALIIGLGNFGSVLARSLSARGVEVLVADRKLDRIRAIADVVADGLCLDATDEEALSRAAPERRDVCVCAIGEESKESSIICTALLKQMGAQRVVARATDPLHARILRLVGASEVIDPEKEFGERFAAVLAYKGILAEMPLGDDLVITEAKLPPSMAGRSLIELELPKRFSIVVVAVRDAETGRVSLPNPTVPLASGDIIVTVAHKGAVARLVERS
ncbi:MAG: TrkA family potassium uptake protein [Myxococcota bacterium]|jgi:trk system potassium uptake protein TrkA|nr:TrkA family potassium uptake protein [Myxococcota bacterium]